MYLIKPRLPLSLALAFLALHAGICGRNGGQDTILRWTGLVVLPMGFALLGMTSYVGIMSAKWILTLLFCR